MRDGELRSLVVELMLLPLFFPLLLVGWVFDDPERLGRRLERERLEAFRRTWLRLHGTVDELGELEPGEGELER